MLPQFSDDLKNDFSIIEYPSLTYRIDYENGCIVGMCDDSESIQQMVYKALNTERFKFEMYSWNYGSELIGLIGLPIPLVYVRIKTAIIDALIYDDRIESVDNFEFEHIRNRVNVKFTVKTIFGSADIEKEVSV